MYSTRSCNISKIQIRKSVTPLQRGSVLFTVGHIYTFLSTRLHQKFCNSLHDGRLHVHKLTNDNDFRGDQCTFR